MVLKAQQCGRSVYSGVWIQDDMEDDTMEDAEEVGVGWTFVSKFRGKTCVGVDENINMNRSKLEEVDREPDTALRSGARDLREGGSGYGGGEAKGYPFETAGKRTSWGQEAGNSRGTNGDWLSVIE